MDVTSGGAVCSNIPPVEFTCVAVEVSFLDWQVNGANIQPTFNIGDNPMTVNSGPYVLSLDRISADSMRPVANMTTRLEANISSLLSGYRVTCLELVAENSVTLHYALRGIILYILLPNWQCVYVRLYDMQFLGLTMQL